MKNVFVLLFLAPVLAHAGSINETIAAEEARRGIPKGLFYNIVRVESNFNPKAINNKALIKSYGLAQLTESTAMEVCRLPLLKIMEPERNLDCGARVLMLLLDHYSVEHAVSAYNMGSPCVCGKSKTFRYIGQDGEEFGSCGGRCAIVGSIKNAKYVELVLNTQKPKIPIIISPTPKLPGIPVQAR